MDLQDIPIFRMMSDKMDWLSERHRVLAQNVANADTPGYAARDLKEVDFRRRAASFATRLDRTDPAHVRPHGEAGNFRVVPERDPYETTLSRNSVVLEEQMVKVADTQADYNLMTSLYRKHVRMLETALGRGGQ